MFTVGYIPLLEGTLACLGTDMGVKAEERKRERSRERGRREANRRSKK